MNHEESKLQQTCVAWFRAQYPRYAMLLTHPANEGNGNRVSGAIHKAEGTVAGVPDLLLFLPTRITEISIYHGLGVEIKTSKGRQSQKQKEFQEMFEAAGYMYVVVRNLEEFQKTINSYIYRTPKDILIYVSEAYCEITKARELKEKEKFYKIIGKK